jgi:hypothetical protein
MAVQRCKFCHCTERRGCLLVAIQVDDIRGPRIHPPGTGIALVRPAPM